MTGKNRKKIITLQVYSLCQGDLQSQLQVVKRYNDNIAASIHSNFREKKSVNTKYIRIYQSYIGFFNTKYISH